MSDENPSLEIRPGMDVFSAYQDRFIGSVIEVFRGARESAPTATRDEEKEQTVQGVSLMHEEGQSADHARAQGSRMNGEEMGPMPTREVGNLGPTNQSASQEYATRERPDSLPGSVYFAVRPGRLNLGRLTRPLYVPTSAVHSISMERVVLGVQDIPPEWRNRPTLRTPQR